MKLSLRKKQEFDLLNFDAIKISLASPEQIREMSFGEVKKTETLNYKTLKPERDGLFCEKIFGPVRDFECSCGKYKKTMTVSSPTVKQIVCNRCGVEVTTSKVRRERMGHIELVVPVAHFWYFGKSQSKIAIFLDMSSADVEEIIYGSAWVTAKDINDINDIVFKSIENLLKEEDFKKSGIEISNLHMDTLSYLFEMNKIPLPRKFILGNKEKYLSKLSLHVSISIKKFIRDFKKDNDKILSLLTKLNVQESELQKIINDLLKLADLIGTNISLSRRIVESIIEDEKYIGNLGDPKNYLKENVSVLTNAEAIYRLLRDEGKEENLKKELENIKKELKELYKQENISRTILLFEKYKKDIDVYKEDKAKMSKIISKIKKQPQETDDLTEEINELKNEIISHIEKGSFSEILSELSGLFKKYNITIQPSPERSKLINRSKLIESFLTKNIKPEWMILTVLPVLPPDLRPLVPIEGGKFASSDLNEFYRRIIHRNNRLRKFFSSTTKESSSKEIVTGGIPKPVLLNEKRLLQEAVDALIENSAKKHPIMMTNQKRPLKSLTDILKGKQGRFRQNLLGKRIDYSGRSTIAVGPWLKLYQCGLPKEMAYELFKPFLIHKLMKKFNVTLKKAKNMVDKKIPEIWDLLEEITKHHVVLLNRAPTLHTPSIQAFEPILVDGKAILIHPMVCAPYNADFDGDQMGVYVPLTLQALAETRLLMTSYFSLFSPANGKVLIGPTQDVVLGISYLTAVKQAEKGEGMIFSSVDEAIHAYQQGIINLNSKIKVVGITDLEIKYENGKPDYSITKDPNKWQQYTTVGRLIFNSILPKEISFFNLSLPEEERNKKNRMLSKNDLVELIKEIYQKCGGYETIKFLDNLKQLGYHYATISGFTISVDDMIIPKGKLEKIKEAQQRIKEVEEQAKEGIITEKERYNSVIDIWSETIEKITKEMLEEMEKVGKEPYKDGVPRVNSVYFMAQSGARGNIDQVRQLSAIRGLMSRPQRKIMGEIGEIIETPILSNFREGLSVLEYFISTHGGRKGLSDTALKTAEAGYLTRRLVDVAHHIVVTEEDCGTINRIKVSALRVGDDIIESLAERIAGRVAADDITYEILDEKTNQVVVKVVKAGEIITEQQAKEIERSGLYESIRIRSVLTCESKRGVCAKCYGMDLSTGKLVEVGKPVGIIAAQSIGEPGTQLTLRTFHIGGAAARLVKQSQIRAPYDGKIEYFSETSTKAGTSEQAYKFKTIQKKDEATGKTFWIVLTSDAILRFVYTTPKGEKKRETWRLEYGARIYVKDNQEVKKGELIADWDLYSIPIISEKSGKIKYCDLKENRTYVVEQISSGNLEKRVLPHRGKENPRLDVVNDKGKTIATYPLPADTVILVEDEQDVVEGDVIAKIPKGEIKTKDITGGLPRVEELFEARHPENSAILADIDGIVKIETKEKDKKIKSTKIEEQQNIEVSVKIINPKATKEVKIPSNRILLVYDGDKVEAGEPLTDGVIDPHKYLEIRGPHHLQEFFLNEIQQVYRLQGVNINDKHIEIIVKQMLSFVRITDPGLPPKPRDNKKFYEFIYGEIVPKKLFDEEVEKINEEKKLLKKQGKQKEADEICPPKAEPVLLGISTVAIWSESFLSAASFQETSRVLTDAAVEGKVDNLPGLKENVIIGKLIPCGTGFYSKEVSSLIKQPEEEILSRVVE